MAAQLEPVLVNRERCEVADRNIPTRVHETCALVVTLRAARAASEPVAGSIAAPPDDQRHEGHRRAVPAAGPSTVHPDPACFPSQFRQRRCRPRLLLARVVASRVVVRVGAASHATRKSAFAAHGKACRCDHHTNRTKSAPPGAVSQSDSGSQE